MTCPPSSSGRVDRIVLVETEARGDEIPHPLDIRLSKNRGRPPGVRSTDDAPVDGVLRQLLPANRGDVGLKHSADPVTVEIGEKLGCGITARVDQSLA